MLSRFLDALHVQAAQSLEVDARALARTTSQFHTRSRAAGAPAVASRAAGAPAVASWVAAGAAAVAAARSRAAPAAFISVPGFLHALHIQTAQLQSEAKAEVSAATARAVVPLRARCRAGRVELALLDPRVRIQAGHSNFAPDAMHGIAEKYPAPAPEAAPARMRICPLADFGHARKRLDSHVTARERGLGHGVFVERVQHRLCGWPVGWVRGPH